MGVAIKWQFSQLWASLTVLCSPYFTIIWTIWNEGLLLMGRMPTEVLKTLSNINVELTFWNIAKHPISQWLEWLRNVPCQLKTFMKSIKNLGDFRTVARNMKFLESDVFYYFFIWVYTLPVFKTAQQNAYDFSTHSQPPFILTMTLQNSLCKDSKSRLSKVTYLWVEMWALLFKILINNHNNMLKTKSV